MAREILCKEAREMEKKKAGLLEGLGTTQVGEEKGMKKRVACGKMGHRGFDCYSSRTRDQHH